MIILCRYKSHHPPDMVLAKTINFFYHKNTFITKFSSFNIVLHIITVDIMGEGKI